jgi:hypothetical protein
LKGLRSGHQIIADFYVVFKNEPFHKFGKIFGLGECEGESINEDALEFAIKNNCKKIMIKYGTERTFTSEIEQWKNSNYRRKQKNGEKTISLPLHELLELKYD